MWPLRFFLAFIFLLCGYVGYNVYGLSSARADLQKFETGYFIGPEDSDLAVVMYLDFTCPFCREVYPVLMEAVKKDGNVKFSPRPVMSMNADGSTAAYLAYAAAPQGKFFEMHDYLMQNFTDLNADKLEAITKSVGLDADKFNADIKTLEVDQRVRNNNIILGVLGGSGTPAIFIGGASQLITNEGFPDVDGFLKIFNQARAQQN
jgi:protein-disulfide isomerase